MTPVNKRTVAKIMKRILEPKDQGGVREQSYLLKMKLPAFKSQPEGEVCRNKKSDY